MSRTDAPENPRPAFKPPTEAQVADYAAGLGLPDPPAVARRFVACYAPAWRDTEDPSRISIPVIGRSRPAKPGLGPGSQVPC